MTHKLKDNKQGFTIIEVLIVLAIAGLILLIVFLAVPALQRSQRNTGRKEDVGRIGTALNDWVTNNNGATLPSGAVGVTDCTTIMGNAGTLNQYTAGTNTACTALPASIAAMQTNGSKYTYYTNGAQSLNLSTAVPAETTSNANDTLIMDSSAVCSTTGTGITTLGTVNQDALIYDVESGSSGVTWVCLAVQ